MMFQDWMSKMRAASAVPFGTAYELFAQKAWDTAIAAERDRWREIVGQLIACHDEPTCPAVTVAKEWLAQQESAPASRVLIPVEVRDLYNFMCTAFTPMTAQQKEIDFSLQRAKAAMAATPR